MTNACKTPEAVMQTLITALAAGLAVWGAVQLLESFQSGSERQRAQALDLIKAGGELVRTATWEVIPPSATWYALLPLHFLFPCGHCPRSRLF